MTTPTPPAWTRSALRLDRPEIDVWWKPEQHGPLDGFLIWQGDLPDRRTREPYRVFAIRDDAAGVVFAVTERAALRSLRHAKLGCRVYIAPGGERDIGDGKRVRDFVVYTQEIMEPAAPPVAAATAPASAFAAASPTAATSNGVPLAGDADDTGADVDGTRIPF